MRVIGIIMETNPFHNGHMYFIKTIIDKYQPDYLIAITSTSFNMRGEISIINKETKIKALLASGVNLVFELPLALSLASADYFAKAAVNILTKLGITDLAFGCESDNLDELNQLISITSSSVYQETFKANLQLKLSYKRNFIKTLEDLKISNPLISLATQPNATLALQYLNCIKETPIRPLIVKRSLTNYNDLLPTASFASATSIRNLLRTSDDQTIINKFLPFPEETIDLKTSEKLLSKLSYYQFFITPPLKSNDGIENYIINNGDFTKTFNNLINSLKNKHYSSSRLRRTIIRVLLQTTNQVDLFNDYFRLLGLDKKGESYLHLVNKELKELIFSSFQELSKLESKLDPLIYQQIFQLAFLEIKGTRLFDLLTNTNTILNEYSLPIRKEIS